ncbi:proteasome assembly chaperone 2-like [Zingiber officinale]|uniref:proteasome assembly chaperone 2-like n=1 Tax=Zingiber officinale TaxID=94328 RepID=UPI001C4D9E49|nr:proteasome assembly chaperone 2-like [Zingiber officinale]XP_042465403.1 proteasome assembly chaperone 2-like [Zingiber officinale]
MEFALEEGRHLSADCPVLLLPGLSIGNVGQLAVDLLISSTAAKRVGFLDAPFLLPCVGNDAYGPEPSGLLSLPLELYESTQHALTLIQQRSPVVKGMMVEFSKEMADFVSSIGKKHIVILSSLDSGRLKKIVASSDMQVYYISSVNSDGTDAECERLGFKRLEEYDSTQRRWAYLNELAEGKLVQDDEINLEEELVDDDYYPGLPFAALLSCCKAKGLKVTCLLCYCSEGDNIPDSFQLADAACKLLKLTPDKLSGDANAQGGWIVPLSWKTVYGPPPDMSLF